MTEIIDLPPGYIPAGGMLRAMYSRGVTDSEVARLTGVNQSTITRLRQGTQKKASADKGYQLFKKTVITVNENRLIVMGCFGNL